MPDVVQLVNTAVKHQEEASTLFPMPVPSGAQANDVLLATVLLRNIAEPGDTPDNDIADGWTNVADASHLGDNGIRIHPYWYRLDGTEGSTVDLLEGNGENKDWIAVTWLLRSANSAPIDGASAVTWSFGDSSVTVPSVTGSDGGVLIGGAAIRDDDLSMTLDSSMTESHNDAGPGGSSGTQYVVGYQDLAADGGAGTRTHTANTTSVGGVGFSIAVHPAPRARVRSTVRESVGPIIAATSHTPSDVSVTVEFFQDIDLTTGSLETLEETLSPGATTLRFYPAPEQSQGGLNRYAGTTKLSRMETSFPAGIATRVQDVTELSGDLIDIGDGEGSIYVTPQSLIDHIFSLWASEFDWFTYATVPDLRLKVGSENDPGNATPSEYAAKDSLGRVPCPAILFPQDDDNELTMRQILDELLSPFPGTIYRQNSSGQLEIVPQYGPDADAAPVVTLTDSDVILVSEGKGDPRTIKNAAVVESQPFTLEADVGALVDAWFAVADWDWDVANAFTTGTGISLNSGEDNLNPTPFPKVWPVDSSRIPDGPILLTDSGGTQMVSIDWEDDDGSSGSYATVDTLNDIPRDGTVVTAIEHETGFGSNLHAIIKGLWVDAGYGGPGVLLWVDESKLRFTSYFGNVTKYTWRINLADATSAWTRDTTTATGRFSVDTGGFLAGLDGANALELSETAFGRRTSRITITGYGITDGSLLTAIAEAHVRHTINPQLVRDVRLSTWRAFPIKFDHIGRLVELPSGEQGVVIARSYDDSFGGAQADGSIACTVRVEVRDASGAGAVDETTEYLYNDDGLVVASLWLNDDGSPSEVL